MYDDVWGRFNKGGYSRIFQGETIIILFKSVQACCEREYLQRCRGSEVQSEVQAWTGDTDLSIRDRAVASPAMPAPMMITLAVGVTLVLGEREGEGEGEGDAVGADDDKDGEDVVRGWRRRRFPAAGVSAAPRKARRRRRRQATRETQTMRLPHLPPPAESAEEETCDP